MDNDIFRYLARLEIMVFFAGYSVIYAFINFLASEFRKKPKAIFSLLKELLPYGYAVSATLFFGFIVKKIYVGYEMNIAVTQLHHPFLVIWGLSAVLFWLRPVRKYAVLSLIHSLVFFYYLPRDIILRVFSNQENDIVKNDMNILTTSLMLNAICLVSVLMIHYLLRYITESRQALNKRQI
jgi:hypothetical protein